MHFKNRKDAAQKLSCALLKHKNEHNIVAVGIARGGVVIATEVAKTLQIPLDVIVPRKIRAPHNPELAIGALIGDGLFSIKVSSGQLAQLRSIFLKP